MLFQKASILFDLFDELASQVVSSAEDLRELALAFPLVQGHVERIRQEKTRADETSRRIFEGLNHSFMPPIDGEDVHALTGGLATIMHDVDALAKRFPLYHVDSVEPIFIKQTEVLVRAATTVREAVNRLRNTRLLSDLGETLIEIHHQESLGDDNHHAALSHLFDGSCDALFVMKWMELFTLAEQAIDACEDVGNILERIVLKNA